MTRKLRIISFLAALTCFAATWGISYLGFELWPPSATLADGRSIPLKSAEVEACARARGLTCSGTATVTCTGELAGMICRDISRPLASELRFWSVIGTADAGMVALFVFALSLRVDSVSLRVLRGARLQAGRQGLKAFARAAAAECQVHKGVALVPSFPLGREIANIEIAPSDLGNRQQTKLQGSREFRQGPYHEMIDAAVGADVGGLSRRSPMSRRGLRMLKPAHLSDEAATDVQARSYLC